MTVGLPEDLALSWIFKDMTYALRRPKAPKECFETDDIES